VKAGLAPAKEEEGGNIAFVQWPVSFAIGGVKERGLVRPWGEGGEKNPCRERGEKLHRGEEEIIPAISLVQKRGRPWMFQTERGRGRVLSHLRKGGGSRKTLLTWGGQNDGRAGGAALTHFSRKKGGGGYSVVP